MDQSEEEEDVDRRRGGDAEKVPAEEDDPATVATGCMIQRVDALGVGCVVTSPLLSLQRYSPVSQWRSCKTRIRRDIAAEELLDERFFRVGDDDDDDDSTVTLAAGTSTVSMEQYHSSLAVRRCLVKVTCRVVVVVLILALPPPP